MVSQFRCKLEWSRAAIRRLQVVLGVNMELDQFNRQLLASIQEERGPDSRALAEQVPLSTSAIQRRLCRMRELRSRLLEENKNCYALYDSAGLKHGQNGPDNSHPRDAPPARTH